MARYKNYSYEQTKFIPISFSRQILEGTFEHTLSYIIDNEVDLDVFASDYKNDETGAPAWDPAIMLKIILYAYSRGIISSRKIEKCCSENVIFMALSADSCPHFTTIANFVSCMEDKIVALFRNILLVCSELDLIGGDMFAIDGCKLSSNASKEWSGTRSDLLKKKEKIEKTLQYIIKRHGEEDEQPSITGDFNNKKAQICKLKSTIKKIDKFLDEHEDKKGKRNYVKQSNITDNESAKMKTSHGVIQGYNGIATVDSKHQVIVHAEVFGDGQESDLLKPAVSGTIYNLKSTGKKENILENKIVTADSGFHSEANLHYLGEENIDAYVADSDFRKRDPRFATADRHYPKKKLKRWFRHEDFVYDKDNDRYVCPAGKLLNLENGKAVIMGLPCRLYSAKTKDCSLCGLRKKCLRKDTTHHRHLLKFEKSDKKNYCREMRKKIDTPLGREIYSQRMAIVEPVFGNIRSSKGLDRFTLRGKRKVNVQWLFYSIVHNIEKIKNYGMQKAA